MQYQYPAGFFNAGFYGFLIPGLQAAEVDDLNGQIVELPGRLGGGVDHRAPGDEGDVVALLVDPRLADRRRVALLGNVALADGSVRAVANGISQATWWAACTPDGGEVLGNDW